MSYSELNDHTRLHNADYADLTLTTRTLYSVDYADLTLTTRTLYSVDYADLTLTTRTLYSRLLSAFPSVVVCL